MKDLVRGGAVSIDEAARLPAQVPENGSQPMIVAAIVDMLDIARLPGSPTYRSRIEDGDRLSTLDLTRSMGAERMAKLSLVLRLA